MEEQLSSLHSSLSSEIARVTFDTLLRIIQNILTRPNEDQFKKLRLGNPTFHQRVWQYAAARQFLILIGWVEAGEFIVYIDESTDHLQTAFDALKKWKDQIENETTSLSTTNGGSVVVMTDKEKHERIRKLREDMRRQQEEKKKIAEQIKADRQEANQKEVKASHSRQLNFGSKLTRFEDIGVDLNSQVNQEDEVNGTPLKEEMSYSISCITDNLSQRQDIMKPRLTNTHGILSDDL